MSENRQADVMVKLILGLFAFAILMAVISVLSEKDKVRSYSGPHYGETAGPSVVETDDFIFKETKWRSVTGEIGTCLWKISKKTGSVSLQTGNSYFCQRTGY